MDLFTKLNEKKYFKNVFVNNVIYKVVSSFELRKTFAIDVITKEIFELSANGYVSNERTIKNRIKAEIQRKVK
jgi:hypothetical protein